MVLFSGEQSILIFWEDKYPDRGDDRVVLIAEYCDSRINSTGLYWQQIAEKLAINMRVTIVSVGVHSDLVDIGCDIKTFAPQSVFLSRFFPEKLHNFFRLILASFSTSIQGANVIVGTNPLFLPLLIPYLKLARVKSLTLLCYDLFPQNLMTQAGPIFRFLLRALSKVYAKAYKLCDNVVVVGRDMKQEVVEIGIPEKQIHYIPNWGPRNHQSCVNVKDDVADQLRILFFGNLGRFQAIPELLEQIIHVQRKDVEFIFVGDGENRNKIKEIAQQDSRIKYLDGIPMSDRDKIYQSAHISFVSVHRGMKGLCVPSKSYFALANQHPILALVEKDSEIDILCEEFQCGWRIDIDRHDSLSAILDEIDKQEYLSKVRNIADISEDLLNGTYSLTLIENLVLGYADS